MISHSLDRYGNYDGAPIGRSAWADGADRFSRGGSWGGTARYCRSAIRSSNDPGLRLNVIGFRLVKDLNRNALVMHFEFFIGNQY
jgi:formylglycine-generating enzyme required for sulfatase activity